MDPSILYLLSAQPSGWTQVAVLGNFRDPRYGAFSITDDMVASWQKNLSAVTGTDQIAIDYDHSADAPLKPTTRAAGWLKALKVEGKKVLAKIEWTPAAEKSIADGEYRFFSPTFTPHYRDQEGNDLGHTLVGGALTNRPVLRRGMTPVMLSQAGEYEPFDVEPITLSLDDGDEPLLTLAWDTDMGWQITLADVSHFDERKIKRDRIGRFAKKIGDLLSYPDGYKGGRLSDEGLDPVIGTRDHPRVKEGETHPAGALIEGDRFIFPDDADRTLYEVVAHADDAPAEDISVVEATGQGGYDKAKVKSVPRSTKVEVRRAVKGGDDRVKRLSSALADSPPMTDFLKTVAKRVGLAEDATEADVLAKLGSADVVKTLAQGAGLQVMTEADVLKLSQDAQAGREAVERETEAKFTAAFDKGVEEGRLAPAAKEQLQTLYQASPEATLTLMADSPKIVPTEPTGERGEGGSATGKEGAAERAFGDKTGTHEIDAESLQLHQRIEARAKQDGSTYSEAALTLAAEGVA